MKDKLYLEYVPIEKLKKWDLNPRVMPEDQAAALTRSLQRFDIVEPLVVDQHNRICGGHQRYDQLVALGVKQVPVIRKHLTPNEFKALNLALNRISGEWDEQKLAPLLAELRDFPEIDLTGFQTAEIDKLIREIMPTENGQEDEIPEPSAEPITKQGVVWQLTKHRIVCADATKQDSWQKFLGGQQVPLVVTDPPYGESYELSTKFNPETGEHHKTWGEIEGDSSTEVAMTTLPNIFANLTENGSAYIFAGKSLLVQLANYCDEHKIHYPPFVVWDKGFAVITWQRYHAEHEMISYCGPGSRPGASSNWFGPKNETTLWRISLDVYGQERLHPTQKPVELFRWAIRNSSMERESVMDPFLGSGTTLIACEQLGRTCMGIEIEPRYVDVAVKRWENLTSRKAIRIGKETS